MSGMRIKLREKNRGVKNENIKSILFVFHYMFRV